MSELEGIRTKESHGRLADRMRERDAGKALTGRTLEDVLVAAGMGMEAKDELFPPNSDVLYIGDPWQKAAGFQTDARLSVIDYEYGDECEFNGDEKDSVLGDLLGDGEYAGMIRTLTKRVEELKSWAGSDQSRVDWVDKVFMPAINAAQEQSYAAGENVERYLALAQVWQGVLAVMQTRLDAEAAVAENPDWIYYPDRETDWFGCERKELWYTINNIKSGYRNIHVYETKIKPEMDRYLEGNEWLSEFMDSMATYRREHPEAEVSVDEQCDILDRLMEKKKGEAIGNALLRKRPGRGEMFKAVFPELPFADRYFDRLVASWSISAHSFSGLNESEMRQCWEEISRVLRVGGKAYIFPMNYDEYIKSERLFSSLNEAATQHGFSWHFLSRWDRHGTLSGKEAMRRLTANDLFIKTEYEEEWIFNAYPTLVIEQHDGAPSIAHLSPGVPPIRLCIDNSAEGGDRELLAAYREELNRSTVSLDVNATPAALKRDGHIAGGDGDDRYLLTAISEKAYRIDYTDATGIFISGLDQDGKGIGFMTFQKPRVVMGNSQEFFHALQERILTLKDRCKSGSIDAAIFGGNISEIGEERGTTSALEYGATVRILNEHLKVLLDRNGVVIGGPLHTFGRASYYAKPSGRELHVLTESRI